MEKAIEIVEGYLSRIYGDSQVAKVQRAVLASIIEDMQRAQQSVQSTLLTDLKNNCVPVNGVHAPFCTGHESQSG